MTQRTGIGEPKPPHRSASPGINPDADEWQVQAPSGLLSPPSEEEDLGLRPGEIFQPDPTGFQPSSQQTVQIAGRAGIPLSGKDLEELHYAHAGVKPMVNDPGSLMDRALPGLTEEEQQVRTAEIERRRELERQRMREEASRRQSVTVLEDELLKDYQINDQVAQPPLKGPAVNAPYYFGTSTTAPGEEVAPTASTSLSGTVVDIGEGAKLLEGLVAKAAEARSRGDIRLANELNVMIQQILTASNLRRSQPKKERHPVLQKLLSTLGLERIKPLDIPWLDMKWRFAPRPEALDWWVAENMGDNGVELNHALISASLIGLDEVPLYQVFNIPLSATYTITATDGGSTTTLNVPAYVKICESCGVEVTLDAISCHTCGALLDPFDIPMELRLRYAAVVKRFLLEKLCLSTEQLRDLVKQYRTLMKDRRLDQEEVYPLIRLLPKEKTAKEKEAEEVQATSGKTPG